jgi:arsenate reductase
MLTFICYPKCSICQKAKSLLDSYHAQYEIRGIKTDNPSYDELKTWLALSELPVRKFFNTSGGLYKSLGLKNKLPAMSEDECLKLLATDGMLVKRPLLVDEFRALVGFNPAEWESVFAEMSNYNIIAVRDNPQYLEQAAAYFSKAFGIAKRVYDDCIAHSITAESPLPRWYLMLDGERIVGCYGLITNDFNSRQDLWPWVCALYVEESERGRSIGSKLLTHSLAEAKAIGFNMVYLYCLTDFVKDV